jgi:AcrR family transcriptional regulator
MRGTPTDFSAVAVADLDATASLPHRRRGAVLEDAITEAVFAELSEVGYAAFTIESVAARAQTGKASIYRRWPTTQDLVLSAFCGRFAAPETFVDGPLADASTRDVFVAIGRRILDVCQSAGESIRAVACEVTRSPELADAIDAQVHCAKRQATIAVLERGVVRGEVRPNAVDPIYAEILPAMIMQQTILFNRPVSDDMVVDLVDRVLMPLIRAD